MAFSGFSMPSFSGQQRNLFDSQGPRSGASAPQSGPFNPTVPQTGGGFQAPPSGSGQTGGPGPGALPKPQPFPGGTGQAPQQGGPFNQRQWNPQMFLQRLRQAQMLYGPGGLGWQRWGFQPQPGQATAVTDPMQTGGGPDIHPPPPLSVGGVPGLSSYPQTQIRPFR